MKSTSEHLSSGNSSGSGTGSLVETRATLVQFFTQALHQPVPSSLCSTLECHFTVEETALIQKHKVMRNWYGTILVAELFANVCAELVFDMDHAVLAVWVRPLKMFSFFQNAWEIWRKMAASACHTSAQGKKIQTDKSPLASADLPQQRRSKNHV